MRLFLILRLDGALNTNQEDHIYKLKEYSIQTQDILIETKLFLDEFKKNVHKSRKPKDQEQYKTITDIHSEVIQTSDKLEEVSNKMNELLNQKNTQSTLESNTNPQNNNTVLSILKKFFAYRDIDDFCIQYFPEIREEDYTKNLHKGQKIQLLFDYCKRENCIDKLLITIQSIKPELFSK